MTVEPRLLVVEGNTAETRRAMVAAGNRETAPFYADTLSFLNPAVRVDILRPTDGERLPNSTSFSDYDGIVWTGSGLNIYNDTPPIRAHIETMRAAFAAGTPIFGSCWGLQVAVVAAGGAVRRNPKGREYAIARKIALTQAGRTHPMYRGKAGVFDAVAIHYDETETLPADSVHLASNGMSHVQALEIRHQGGEFWGVQYHPETDLREIGLYGRRYAAAMVRDGFFADEQGAADFAADCALLQETGRSDLAWRLGVDQDVLDPSVRLREIANWLDVKAVPRARARG